MNYKKSLQHSVFKAIGKIADKRGERVFVIGGFVRDLILDRPSKDIDIVTEGKGVDIAKDVAKGFVVLAKANKTTGDVMTIDGGNISAALR